jgi:GDP-L-fucose synthase
MELNLLDSQSINNYLNQHDVNSIFYSAASVGGLGANVRNGLKMLTDNLSMEVNFLTAALQRRIKRLIFLSSSSIYPEFADLPLDEEKILSGKPSESVRPYAIAKIAGMEIVKLANERFDLPWISVVPANIYGPNDNYRLNESHVVAATIRKVWEMKNHEVQSIEIWGFPTDARDLLLSDDLARALLFLEDKYFDSKPVNISPGNFHTIEELVKLVCKIMNVEGKVEWNSSQPSGTSRKYLSNTFLTKLGFSSFTPLEKGLSLVIEDFEKLAADGFRELRWDESKL